MLTYYNTLKSKLARVTLFQGSSAKREPWGASNNLSKEDFMYIVLSKEEQKSLTQEEVNCILSALQPEADKLVALARVAQKQRQKPLMDQSKVSSTGKTIKRKYDINHHFFSEVNYHTSYWAGFIAADGYITGNNAVGIKLQKRDKPHLELFKEECAFTGPIRDYKVTTNKAIDNWQSRFLVSGLNYWAEDLNRNFCITRNKSFSLVPPSHLTLDNALNYIKGLIDGDGCITGRDSFRIELLCTESIAIWVQQVVNSVTAKYKRNDSNNIRVYKATPDLRIYQVAGIQAVALAQVMLDFDSPFLERKWSSLFSLAKSQGRLLE